MEFATIPGNVGLSAATQGTVSGQAEITATAQQAGLELALARVPGTLASGAVWLLKVDDFSDVIFRQGRLFLPPEFSVRTLAYMVVNLSNRDFEFVSIDVFEAGVQIGEVQDVSQINDGKLDGGEQAIVLLAENNDFNFDELDLENVYAVFTMSDAATQTTFQVRVDPIIE